VRSRSDWYSLYWSGAEHYHTLRISRFKMSPNTQPIHTRCDSEAGNEPKLVVFGLLGKLIPRLHDRANIEQTSSKIARVFLIHLLDVCSLFARSCKRRSHRLPSRLERRTPLPHIFPWRFGLLDSRRLRCLDCHHRLFCFYKIKRCKLMYA